MAEQLIFTSAPKGLKPGTRGYTTVAATRGISPPLMTRMEGMSGYRLAFNVSDARADQNPVAYSHQLLSHGGVRASMLSRIAACGVDYSGRSNFIAHHLVLEAADRTESGPAWLLAQPSVMRQAWEGTPSYIDAPPPLPNMDIAPAPCRAWEIAAGDAGWAGVLLEQLRDKPRSPVYIVYEAGTELLPLFSEAIALLPPKLRWRATFNTYFNNAAPEAMCMWRGVLAGSPASSEIANAAGATVIDLTAGPRKAADHEFTLAAREGRSAEDLFSARPAPVMRPSAVTDPDDEITIADDAEDKEFFDESKDYDFDVFDESPGQPARATTGRAGSRMAVSAAPPRRKRKRPALTLAVVSLLLLTAFGVGFGLWRTSQFNTAVEQHAASLNQMLDDGDLGGATHRLDQLGSQEIAIATDPRIIKVEKRLSVLVEQRNEKFTNLYEGIVASCYEVEKREARVNPIVDQNLAELESLAWTPIQIERSATLKRKWSVIKDAHNNLRNVIFDGFRSGINNLELLVGSKPALPDHAQWNAKLDTAIDELKKASSAIQASKLFDTNEKQKVEAEKGKAIAIAINAKPTNHSGILPPDPDAKEPTQTTDPAVRNPKPPLAACMLKFSRKPGRDVKVIRRLINPGNNKSIPSADNSLKIIYSQKIEERDASTTYTLYQGTSGSTFPLKLPRRDPAAQAYQVFASGGKFGTASKDTPVGQIIFKTIQKDSGPVIVEFQPADAFELSDDVRSVMVWDNGENQIYQLELPRLHRVDVRIDPGGRGDGKLNLPSEFNPAAISPNWTEIEDGTTWINDEVELIIHTTREDSDSPDSERSIEVKIPRVEDLHVRFSELRKQHGDLEREQKKDGTFGNRIEQNNKEIEFYDRNWPNKKNKKAYAKHEAEIQSLKKRVQELDRKNKIFNALPDQIADVRTKHKDLRKSLIANGTRRISIGPDEHSHHIQLTLTSFLPLK